jgi:hypothetical protein
MTRLGSQVRLIVPRRLTLTILITGCTFVSGCANLKLAERAVELFHSQLNSERYRAIYQSADTKVRGTTSESTYVKFLQSVHQALGSVQTSVLRSENVALSPPTVTLYYDTTFERGTAKEQFVWLIKGNEAILDTYSIDSNKLRATTEHR